MPASRFWCYCVAPCWAVLGWSDYPQKKGSGQWLSSKELAFILWSSSISPVFNGIFYVDIGLERLREHWKCGIGRYAKQFVLSFLWFLGSEMSLPRLAVQAVSRKVWSVTQFSSWWQLYGQNKEKQIYIYLELNFRGLWSLVWVWLVSQHCPSTTQDFWSLQYLLNFRGSPPMYIKPGFCPGVQVSQVLLCSAILEYRFYCRTMNIQLLVQTAPFAVAGVCSWGEL